MKYDELLKELRERRRVLQYNEMIKYAETLTHTFPCSDESIDPDVVMQRSSNDAIFIAGN